MNMLSRLLLATLSAVSFSALAEDSLRETFFAGARPAVAELLRNTESNIGARVVFCALPDNDSVAARSIYDTSRHEAKVMLRKGWEDVEVAHELMHTRMDLVEGFHVLAWRRDVPRAKDVGAAFGRLQTYVNDEVVHAHLADLGLAIDREVFRPPLFDSIYTDVPRRLEAKRGRTNDGMAHLDKEGYGTLVRVCFLVQAERLLLQYRDRLPKERVAKTEHFVRTVRTCHPDVAERANAVLALFREHDVMKPAGQREILKAWAAMEGLDRFVGISAYQRTEKGDFTLPFPD